MKNLTLSLFMLSLLLTFSISAADEPHTAFKSHAKNLFIIAANGLRYNDAFGNKNHLYTDNIWNTLRPLGTICTKFYNTECTYPLPAQASLLTGVWHVVNNPLTDTIRPPFPTLFEYWNRTKPGVSCYFAASNKNQGILTHSDYTDYGKTYAPVFAMFDTNMTRGIDTSKTDSIPESIDNTIYQKTISYIVRQHPSFVFLNSGCENEYHDEECDIKDKKDDCGGADLLNAYYESIILTDANVYDLWNKIQSDEFYKDNSVFIFLSAHGRHTDDFHGYGDKCDGCQHLNFLIIGPGVKKDFVSKKKRTLIDVCRTIGTLCDVPTPLAKGVVMREILE